MLHVLPILASIFLMPASAEDDPILAASVNPKSQIQNQKSELSSASEILAQVRANLPREAILIKGQILSGGRIGKLERVGHIEMLLDFGSDPAIVCYKISDAFGAPVEQMTVSLTADSEAEFEYEAGNPLRPAAAPAPEAFIRETDFTWNDLSLLFLWRSDGRVVRAESLRGRDCYVIEFPGNAGAAIQNPQPQAGPPPADHATADPLQAGKSPAAGWSASGGQPEIQNLTVLWIDAQMLVLIQMEELDGRGKLQRRMVVKNIKKISDRWMIKDLEMRSYPSLRHTLIRVDGIVPGPQSTVASQ